MMNDVMREADGTHKLTNDVTMMCFPSFQIRSKRLFQTTANAHFKGSVHFASRRLIVGD